MLALYRWLRTDAEAPPRWLTGSRADGSRRDVAALQTTEERQQPCHPEQRACERREGSPTPDAQTWEILRSRTYRVGLLTAAQDDRVARGLRQCATSLRHPET